MRLRGFGQDRYSALRQTLLDVFAEVYANRLNQPVWRPESYAARLDANAACEGWHAVLAFDGPQPVGYVYGVPLPAATSYWSGLDAQAELLRENGKRTFATFDLMIRKPWRGGGLGYRLHEQLLIGRSEQRAAGTVEHSSPAMLAAYERWGYQRIGAKRALAGTGPLIDMMVRDLARYPAHTRRVG